MDEAFRKTAIAAASQVNPKLASSCPLSTLVDGFLKEEKNKSTLVQRLVLYSKAPPAMLHVNQLLSYTDPPADEEPSSDASKFDLEKFVSFFTPRLMSDTSISTAKSIDISGDLAEEISSIDESEVDDILRDALLEASEQLEKQFGSLSPSPMELLKKSSSTKASQVSIDVAFAKSIEAVLARLQQADPNPHQLKLVEFAVAAIDTSATDFPTKLAVAERLIFSVVPHPEATSGSDVLLKCFRNAILRVQSELSTDIPVEALIAAIERLPADSEVKLFLTQIMIETSLRDWSRKGDVQVIGMKTKFKVPVENQAEEEIECLKVEIKRLGQPQQDGSIKVTFGVLFNDDQCTNIFEELVGTLKAAKRRNILSYDGELLLQGVHDNVEITLKPSE